MYQLTISGKAVGQKYTNEEGVWAAYVRMRPSILGLWWRKVSP
ncbi:hypothetical protein [Paenibacillus foliorum]|nr:hypothetical protein [Paenibacillus foliorum]